MVIGNGDIASALKDLDRDDFIFFASGVSDSQCNDIREFKRERDMVWGLYNSDISSKNFIYFSSLSIFDKETPYTMHKKSMENLVKVFSYYNIIRIGNIAWGKNPNTVVNYFRNAIANNQPVTLRDEYKYICTLEDFKYWIKKIPDFNCEMNITGERIHAKELYKRLNDDKLHDDYLIGNPL